MSCYTYFTCVCCIWLNYNSSALWISSQREAPGVSQIVWFVIWYVLSVCRPPYHRKSPTVSTAGVCVTLITFDSCSNFTASAYLEEKSAAIISTFTTLPYCPFLHLFSEVNCNWWYYLKPWFNNLANPLGLLRTGCCRTEHLLCSRKVGSFRVKSWNYGVQDKTIFGIRNIWFGKLMNILCRNGEDFYACAQMMNTMMKNWNRCFYHENLWLFPLNTKRSVAVWLRLKCMLVSGMLWIGRLHCVWSGAMFRLEEH